MNYLTALIVAPVLAYAATQTVPSDRPILRTSILAGMLLIAGVVTIANK
jgi:hypothetical protein